MRPERSRRPSAVHGVRLGIIVLDTAFRRIPGDVGNAETWGFPVQFAVVRGLTPQGLIRGDPNVYLPPVFEAIDSLVALGVDGITTSGGFFAAAHPALAAHSPVPIASSSLLQIPMVRAMLAPDRTIGVIASDRAKLTSAHFRGVGAPDDLPVAGLPEGGVIRTAMASGALEIDIVAQEAEALEVARALVDARPDIGALVFECANLAPYSRTIQAALGVPVFDIVSLVNWFHAGLRPRRFARD